MLNQIKRYQWLVVFFIVVTAGYLVYTFFIGNNSTPLVINLDGEKVNGDMMNLNQFVDSSKENYNDKEAKEAGSAGEVSDTENPKIVVYVSGGVKEPGVYTLDEGARIYQLIKLAGGEYEDSLLDLLNLAAPLKDGQHIHVFRDDDEIHEAMTQYHITEEENDSTININTAENMELQMLPGIGPVRAENILRYRASIGTFSHIEQIKEVHGIGEGIYNQIKDLIKVD